MVRLCTSNEATTAVPGKAYMWPLPEDHAEVVICGNSASLPCRALFMMCKQFSLPADMCGIDFAKDLNSPEHVAVNPIHSIPCALVYDKSKPEAPPVSINGGEAIVYFLKEKFGNLIPDSFIPSDPLKKAAMMQKYFFISTVVYRATMYQYVYPLMGLMSECQYDICKRDFSLGIVEDWAKAGSPFFEGSEPSWADFFFFSLWMGNNWAQNDDIKAPWKHKDVIDQYPATKAIIEAVSKLEGVKHICSTAIGEGDAPVELVNQTGFFGMLAKEMPGNARKFNFTEGGTVHPNMVGYSEDKGKYDMPLSL